jgi:hypothetical protein
VGLVLERSQVSGAKEIRLTRDLSGGKIDKVASALSPDDIEALTSHLDVVR